jgi:hypothetical protein
MRKAWLDSLHESNLEPMRPVRRREKGGMGKVCYLNSPLKSSSEPVAALCERRFSEGIPKSALTERRYRGFFNGLPSLTIFPVSKPLPTPSNQTMTLAEANCGCGHNHPEYRTERPLKPLNPPPETTMKYIPFPRAAIEATILAWLTLAFLSAAQAQTLINVDFGAGATSAKAGFAATGQATNDFWNRYHHYEPKFLPGMPFVANGRLESLKLADSSLSRAAITVTNAPGVWGNATGDPMFDSYLFAPNGSNLVVTLAGLEAGRYHFYLYGHADADVTGEQNSVFSLRSGTNHFGPMVAAGSTAWQAGQPWREGAQYIVFRDVPVTAGESLAIEVAPGPGGIAVLNGLQILSRGTAPPRLVRPDAAPAVAGLTNLLFREVRYEGRLGTNEARFTVALDAESRSTNELSALLFEGDLALLAPELPAGWRIVNQGRKFHLFAAAPGSHQLKMELVAKVQRAEPWNQISFSGPPAAIAAVAAQAVASDTEVQLLSGTALETGNKSLARGILGANQQLTLRWQSKTAEVNRDALVTVDSKITASLTPSAIRYTSQFRYEILQSRLSQLKLRLPPGHTLTKLDGEQIRDWQLTTDNGQPAIAIDFIRPVESATTLTLTTEQALTMLPSSVELIPPAPLAVQREVGMFKLTAEDVVVRVETTAGLRQVNTSDNEVAAFRFNGRPASLQAQVARIEPVVTVAARVHALLEENRLLVRHDLSLNAAKAGIYALDLTPQPGFAVAEVKGDGVDDWKVAGNQLRISFTQRVLGDRKFSVQLEQSFTNLPPQWTILPLRVTGATKETAFIGAGSSAGLQLKTDAREGVREIPVTALPERKNELLAFRAEQGDWRIVLAAERLAPRLVAEVFNLITIGDGLVGGSATIRYAIFNQGVQQFRVRLPAHWRNVEFTGLNLRRKDQQDGVWTISLQDKAWGGYTLVITYDHAFDPKKATLDAAGAHPLDVERESGTVAVTSAPGLAIVPSPVADPLRAIDPSELAGTDLALITRPVLLAYRYDGSAFALSLNVTRHDEVAVLDAIADRAQLTSVLTDTGEMLTQASFMVKNNERQFQRFQLPPGSTLWGVAVNGEPVKADRDGNWLLVSLPRGVDRDQAFAVDIKYAQQFGKLGGWRPRELELLAPKTDVPGTYAEWELFAPPSKRVADFTGNMTAARGIAYGFREGWDEFIRVYQGLWHDYGATLIFGGGFLAFIITLILWGRRRGFQGVVAVLSVFCVLAILGGMMLPALSKAKSKAQRIKSVNNLKNIGLAARIFATDNGERLPVSFEEMMTELSTDKILYDPETGERYTYVGAGKKADDPHAIIAYSSDKRGHREVVLADGSVQQVTSARFAEMLATEAVGGTAPNAPLDPALAQRYGLAAQVPAPAAPPTPNQPGGAGRGGRRGGLAGGMLGAAGPQAGGAIANGAVAATNAVPAITGIKSLRIEVPRTGRAFHFTRVLNLSGEPPAVRVSVMSAKAFTVMQMSFQLATFLVGLFLIWREWSRAENRAFVLAIGIGLVLIGTANLFIAWRALHLVLIVAVPALTLLLLSWIIWRFSRRSPNGTASEPATPPELSPIPPGTAALLLFLTPFAGDLALAQAPPTAPPPVSIVSANFTGIARESVAELNATIDFISMGTNVTVALFGKEVAVQEFTASAGAIRLWREGEKIGVLLPEPGVASAQMKLLVKLSGDASRRRIEFGLPSALGSRLTLLIDEPDADVEFPSAVTFQRTPQDKQTRVEAVLGATNSVSLAWTPRLKRASEVAAMAFVQQTSLVTFGGGVAGTRSVLDYQVMQGELRQLRVALPAGQRLLRVSGASVHSWDFAETNRNEIVVELLKGTSPSVRLVVETETALDQLPATFGVLLPRALNVNRSTGLVAVRAGDELGLTAERTSGLERVESAEFMRAFGGEQISLVSAWRFLRPDFELVVRAEVLQPRLEAVAHHHFTVGLDQVSISARLDYTVSRAGVFTLRLALPAEARVETVACDQMQTWSERTENATRLLEISLKQRTLGAAVVTVQLARPITNLPPTLELASAHPLGVDKLQGFVSISSEAGVGLKTGALSGLTEIPAAILPGTARPASSGTGLLAFKYLANEPQPVAPWRLNVTIESIESWVRAEIVNFVTVSETLVSGRSLVRYEIQNAPVKNFQVRVPAAWRNVELIGAGIRRRDRTNDLWRVELQNRVFGEYRLTVHWEMPRPAGTNELAFTGVEAVNVERETGALSFSARAPLQLTPKQSAGDLMRVDVRELPPWADERIVNNGTAVLTYRYLRPGWRLALDVQRFTEAALLQALVENARFRTVVADDGQLMTQMELTIRNNGRQHLDLALPAGAQVWSAFVAGQPVRPAQNGGRLLLPLDGAGQGEPILIDVTYVSSARFPRTRGKVELASPLLDVPLKDARWELFLPPDYNYDKFGGSMTYERADLAPVVMDFTLGEYKRQQAASEASVAAQAVDFLSKAKSDLSAGNLKESSDRFNYFRNGNVRNEAQKREIDQLEGELKRAQSSNLIIAQNQLNFDNSARFGQDGANPAGGQPSQQKAIQYDVKVAEQQVAQVQKAQAVAVTRVTPLRVNLPTRGLRHSFAQVLQTEVNKPLTITLTAANDRQMGWFKTTALWAGGFLGLWILAAAVTFARRPHETA